MSHLSPCLPPTLLAQFADRDSDPHLLRSLSPSDEDLLLDTLFGGIEAATDHAALAAARLELEVGTAISVPSTAPQPAGQVRSATEARTAH